MSQETRELLEGIKMLYRTSSTPSPQPLDWLLQRSRKYLYLLRLKPKFPDHPAGSILTILLDWSGSAFNGKPQHRHTQPGAMFLLKDCYYSV